VNDEIEVQQNAEIQFCSNIFGSILKINIHEYKIRSRFRKISSLP
jgi:hypothetical protein